MGLFGDMMGTSLKAKFAGYANQQHLHPRERIRSFLVNEKAEKHLATRDWMDAADTVFDFAQNTDPRGELKMYAAAAFARAAFKPIGTVRLDLAPGANSWRAKIIFFQPNISTAPESFAHYFGGCLINYFPGFPAQWSLSEPISARMTGSQANLGFRRYAHKPTGHICYIPLYDDGNPVVIPEMSVSDDDWESKIT